MGLETRHGNLYYYRKRREGGRVISEYAGGGHVAGLFAALDGEARAKHEVKAAEREARREADRRADSTLDELRAACDALAAASLLARGCHTHKGEWRRRRCPKK